MLENSFEIQEMYTNLNQIPNVSDESIHATLKSRFDTSRYTTPLGYFTCVYLNHPCTSWSDMITFVNKMDAHRIRDEKDQVLYFL